MGKWQSLGGTGIHFSPLSAILDNVTKMGNSESPVQASFWPDFRRLITAGCHFAVKQQILAEKVNKTAGGRDRAPVPPLDSSRPRRGRSITSVPTESRDPTGMAKSGICMNFG